MVFTRQGYKKLGISPIRNITWDKEVGDKKKLLTFPPSERVVLTNNKDNIDDNHDDISRSSHTPNLEWSIDYKGGTYE